MAFAKGNIPWNKSEAAKKAGQARRWKRYQGSPHGRERIRLAQRKRRKENPKQQERRYRTALMRKYGMTQDDYDRIYFLEQTLGCAICERTTPGVKKGKFLRVDHDHKTGRVRGLLCHFCNVGIGHFQEDTRLLKRAIAYLERDRCA